MKSKSLLLLFNVLLCSTMPCFPDGQSPDDPMQVLAKTLAERIAARSEDRARVTVLDFTDIRNRPNELGRYLALQLANEMVNLTNIAVLDRANIATIMSEHKLTAEGLLKPEEAKKLGQFAGVDAILIGNVSEVGNNLEAIVRAISTETSEILASGKARLAAEEDFRRMLGLSVDNATTSGVDRVFESGTATALQGEVIAERKVGPITAILRNVAEHSVAMGDNNNARIVPAIRCTFDLWNRNLERSVAIAANQRVMQQLHAMSPILHVNGYRGGLVDSGRSQWTMRDVNGISAVACFEFTEGSFTQRNPGAIVDYIHTAPKYDGGRFEYGHSSRHWAGALSAISPGDTIRMTVDFVPTAMTENRNGPRRSTDSLQRIRPAHFQLDLELVLGTYADGEDSTKAKDMALRNLTIDRVVLPELRTAPTP